MLRRESSADADDWGAFAGVLGGERSAAGAQHPADRGAGQTWLIGQTSSAASSGSGNGLRRQLSHAAL